MSCCFLYSNIKDTAEFIIKKQIEVFLTIILLFTTIVPIGLRTDTFDMNYGYSAWWMGILF